MDKEQVIKFFGSQTTKDATELLKIIIKEYGAFVLLDEILVEIVEIMDLDEVEKIVEDIRNDAAY